MAKKKRFKKHQFKERSSSVAASSTSATTTQTQTPTAKTSSKTTVITPVVSNTAEFAYVKHDVRKVLILAGAFVAAQIILWYLFQTTTLDERIYGLIKV